ncbi:chloride channel CLIC-like protein 1 isoform X2 [Fundulus heteroclitus]|uniref:chloride channel CLIC-like protein 1 isoform X2 n=1 Tax=Fundulus heteroclitus TaxID=8078 RepID=UPI00165AC901|nr:chloride channel CLIC-like protein 1 isoform X2 [Fundulus heteroclitus]
MVRMPLLLLLCCLSLSAWGQHDDGDWVDPYDMINYDSSTKTMRKPSEIEDQKREIKLMSQQPTCNPVFKRFLSRLLKEIQRLGVPTDSSDVLYDAKIKLSKQGMTEIQSLLDGEDRWRTGALDSAISQILVDIKPLDYETWKWRFEDTFGVELDTVVKVALLVLLISTIVCTQLWSAVSWFMQFKRMFAVCFVISIIWNWFYLYQTAFAKHQNDIVKMENFNAKCTGVKKIDFWDNLKEFFRTTMTLQDDPCKKYYEVLIVNPLLLVPPTKAISVTITTFITEPLKHLGQGINEFLRELLKDLPIILQIPVLFTIVLSVMVFMYGGVQAAFQHGIMGLFRHHQRDPPPPELEQRRPLRIEDHGYLAGGDAPARPTMPAVDQQHVPLYQGDNARLDRNNLQRRLPCRVREAPAPIGVETLKAADPLFSVDGVDGEQHEESPELAENTSVDSGSEEQQEAPEDVEGESPSAKNDVPENQQAESNSSQAKKKPIKTKEPGSQDNPSRDVTAALPRPTETQRSQTDQVQDPEASAKEKTPLASLTRVETVGVPV